MTAQCTSWYTPDKRRCPSEAAESHRWCVEHQAIAEQAREVARKKDVDPDAWRHFRYVEHGIPWQQGTPGPSDRARSAKKFWDGTNRPAVDPLRIPKPVSFRPCGACLFEIGNLPSFGDTSWHNAPEGSQRRYAGGRRLTTGEERGRRSAIQAIRAKCFEAQHVANEDVIGKTVGEAA